MLFITWMLMITPSRVLAIIIGTGRQVSLLFVVKLPWKKIFIFTRHFKEFDFYIQRIWTEIVLRLRGIRKR